jgi:hypothetical protein
MNNEIPKPFRIVQDGELVNKWDFVLFDAKNALETIKRASNVAFNVGELVINHIVDSAQQ